MADVRVLGTFEAWVDGGTADLGGPRQRSVLARLVAARGRMVPADRLVEDLWPGEAPPRATAGLQSFVSHLRRALEPDRPPRTPARVLVTAPPGYALHLPDADVDAWRFDALVDEAARLLDAADAVRARECAQAALAEWRGPAYAEFADLPWAVAETARLDERRRLAVERRAEAMLRLGAAAEAVPDLEAHAAANPLREEVWRLLALALYRTGRQGDALAALRRARATLAEELGVDPGPALRRLESGILAQAPELTGGPRHGAVLEAPAEIATAPARAASAPDVPPPPGTAGGIFVGRHDELERLAAAARDAAAGRCGLVLIAGDAGMGKTALAERLTAALARDGWTTAWGRVPETGGAPPAWPWAELLRELISAAPPPPELARRMTLLEGDVPAVPAADIATGRFRLQLAVGDYLSGLAGRAPLLLVLDDLHWADGDTLALLAALPRMLRDRPVLLAGTFRQTEVSERLADALALLARHEPLRLDLAGLPAADVAVLIRAVCGAEVDEAELAVIAERTGGNPFFTRETVRLLDAGGLPAATRLVPAGAGDVLRRRVAGLPENARTVLRNAAVVGREADLDVLTDVCGGDEDAVIDAVEAGLAAGLVTEPGPGRVRFAHTLVRDTLYTGLSRVRRARLHGRVAAALERRRPGGVAAIAHHHLEAGGADPAKAVRYARLAAEEAESRFAHRAAADLWIRAVDALRAAGDDRPLSGDDRPLSGDARDRRVRERLELEAAAIRSTALAGDVVEARERRRRALDAARPLGDARLLARLITSFDVPTVWTSRDYGSHDQDVIDAAEEALEGLAGPDDDELRARLLTSLAIELEGARSDRGVTAAEEAVRVARRLGRPELLAVALNGRYLNGYRGAGAFTDRRLVAAELLDLATAHGLGLYQGLVHLQLQQVAICALDLETARRHRDEGVRLAGRFGLPLLGMIADSLEGLTHSLAARFDEAELAYRQLARSGTGTGIWNSERGIALVGIFCVRYVQGRAGELVDEARWIWERWRHVDATAEVYALALIGAGRAGEARRVVEGVGPARYDYFFDLITAMRGRRAIALDDRRVAAEAYTALLPYEDHLAGGPTGVVTIGPAAQTLGDLAVFLGRPDRAAGHYRRAAEIAERVGSPYWAGVARDSLHAVDPGAPPVDDPFHRVGDN
ncbi:BTAD domain-containing putative transcriptional regulator [Actinomadura viridis]|uniref:DNA-binding SARP family transcriptional activator n=1 Tax=Actinomadura viridis TaxID=58110 RepID=A0A931DG74_9ACTN|nr:BTAD domain-containing putative transcriptional regulator [Actinomadura viridis]MBG6088033.1 DNA-binding SARP family transcriptional activator [Actinomadura viridis]